MTSGLHGPRAAHMEHRASRAGIRKHGLLATEENKVVRSGVLG